MTDLNGVFKFSLGIDQLSFEMDGQHIQLDQGLSFIQSNSMRHGLLDELAIESMIYVIEELLESVQMQYAQPKTAVTSDVLFQKALALFFQISSKLTVCSLKVLLIYLLSAGNIMCLKWSMTVFLVWFTLLYCGR